jgi:hypothetical protein
MLYSICYITSCKIPISQVLRGASQPLQIWESHEAAPHTEEPFEFVDAQVPLMSFVLRHTEAGETIGHMMQLRPLARLRAMDLLPGAPAAAWNGMPEPRSFWSRSE